MEGTPTPDLYDLLKKVSESPMLGFNPAEYFERATLIFMQFSQMSRKINENHSLLTWKKLTICCGRSQKRSENHFSALAAPLTPFSTSSLLFVASQTVSFLWRFLAPFETD